MGQRIIGVVAVLTAVGSSFGACSEGVVSGFAQSVFENGPGEGTVNLWVAGTQHGALLQQFILKETNGGVGSTFVGDRCLSIEFSHDPLVGKTVDMWLEGRLDGATRIMHFLCTDSEAPALFNPREYVVYQIYHPQNTARATKQKMWMVNNFRVLNILDGCGEGSAPGLAFSDTGIAYRREGSPAGTTNAGSIALLYFWISGTSNSMYLQKFVYYEALPGTARILSGDRPTLFQCTNHSFFGRAAEFWIDGRLSTGFGAGTATKARVIVTESAALFGLEIAYIAFYMPSAPTTPYYERIIFFPLGTGQTHILCPD